MKAKFVILRAVSPFPRCEFINIGLVVFQATDRPIVRIEAPHARLLALDPNYPNLPVWIGAASEIERLLVGLTPEDSLHQLLSGYFDPIQCAAECGELSYSGDGQLSERIESLLDRFVRRATIVVRPNDVQAKASKLNTEVRDWLKRSKLFSPHLEDIKNRRVVASYPVRAEAGLYAEFALKNGAVHVIETVDMRGHDRLTASVQKDAAIKSIVLDQAKANLSKSSRRLALVAASDYGAMKPAINMISGYASDVIVKDSESDLRRLVDFLAKSLHLPQLPVFLSPPSKRTKSRQIPHMN